MSVPNDSDEGVVRISMHLISQYQMLIYSPTNI